MMLWAYVEKKIKKALRPKITYYSPNIPKPVRRRMYKELGPHIRFSKPGYWKYRLPPSLYYYYFESVRERRRRYGYLVYPTAEGIKFFNFTLFKKNGLLFFIFCCIIFRKCLGTFILLLLKSALSFAILLYFFYYLLLLYRKFLIIRRALYLVPSRYITYAQFFSLIF